ncbi:MAG: lytic murein transglycosylase [Gammaproteobacteria bacterium]|nr:lytic murein transglycosylase [Gammaproteobacteria bacterium]MDH5592535.1 lytic murein transglycosylase [Gammaproteobacteria bacterium]
MRQFVIGLALILAGITALMLIPSKQDQAPMPWEITIMPDDSIKVFGVHLGSTTYRHTQELFRQFGKTAVFTQEGKASTVEAFFDSIHLGGLSAKVILNLKVSEQQLNDMLSHATEARLQPSGARRYQLSNADNAALINSPIIAITYIPSVRLDKDMVRHRFGTPDYIEHELESPDTEIWHYPTLGLSISLNDSEKTVLLYQSYSEQKAK